MTKLLILNIFYIFVLGHSQLNGRVWSIFREKGRLRTYSSVFKLRNFDYSQEDTAT